MTGNYTLRDFLVYFSTGAFCCALIYILDVHCWNQKSVDFFKNYQIVKEFAPALIIPIIPVLYVVGHIVHALGVVSLKLYVTLHIFLTVKGYRKKKGVEFFREILHYFLYRAKVVNAIIEEMKSNKTWRDVNDFYRSCAVLQLHQVYKDVSYYHLLNDLSKGLYTVFILSAFWQLIAFQFKVFLVLLILALIFNHRAMFFAKNYVNSVKYLYEELDKQAARKT